MFRLVNDKWITISLKNLEKKERNSNKESSPTLVGRMKYTKDIDFFAFLRPVQDDAGPGMVVFIDEQFFMDVRLRSNVLKPVLRFLPDLLGIHRSLTRSKIAFREGLEKAVLRAFKAESLSECEAVLRDACWAMDYALWGAAKRQYESQYKRLVRLFDNVNNLLHFPERQKIGYFDLIGHPEPKPFGGVWGMPFDEILAERYRDRIQLALHEILGPKAGSLRFEYEGSPLWDYDEIDRAWQEFFGEVWGPFMSGTAFDLI